MCSMGLIRNVFLEIRKQLLNIPSFAKDFQKEEKYIAQEQLEGVNKHIEKAIKNFPDKIVFILAPFGSGKTTQLKYFFKKYRKLKPKYHSCVRLNTLDFAFLQLVSYTSRFIFLSFFVVIFTS